MLGLARDAGVTVGEVYSVDASRRTTAANAYVTGLGPTKRVVLFDTLLDRYSRDEIRLVVAHELGHVRHRDVLRACPLRGDRRPGRGAGRAAPELGDRRERGTPAALPALALAAALVSAPIGLIGNRLSRAIERRADHFSLQLAGAPQAFVSFERTIALQNVADSIPRGGSAGLLDRTHRPRSGSAPRWRSLRPSRAGPQRAASVRIGRAETITQFCPPKPNALAAAVRTSARAGRAAGRSPGRIAGSGVCRLVVGGRTPSRIASTQTIADSAPAGADQVPDHRFGRAGRHPSASSPSAMRIARVSDASLARVPVPWAQM